VHGLEQQYGDKVNFVYLDIDDSRNDSFKRQLGYRVQPHIFLLDGNGQVIEQWLGLVSKDDLEAALKAVAS
jgi:thioredoxin-like negative regulator of GroEL